MSDASAVKDISEAQREHKLDSGLVRAVRGQYIDVVLDGSRRQVRDVLLAKSVTEVQVGWWAVVVRIPRTRRWVAIVALESVTGGSRATVINLSQPGSVTATAKPYMIGLSWAGSFQDAATYEVQHNSSASASGATTIKVEGSSYLYWCNPGTERFFRVRSVSSSLERSSWSAWVSATATQGDSYMSLCVTAGGDVSWMPFDWDNVSGVLQADVVHDHSGDAEGGSALAPATVTATGEIKADGDTAGLSERTVKMWKDPDENCRGAWNWLTTGWASTPFADTPSVEDFVTYPDLAWIGDDTTNDRFMRYRTLNYTIDTAYEVYARVASVADCEAGIRLDTDDDNDFAEIYIKTTSTGLCDVVVRWQENGVVINTTTAISQIPIQWFFVSLRITADNVVYGFYGIDLPQGAYIGVSLGDIDNWSEVPTRGGVIFKRTASADGASRRGLYDSFYTDIPAA